jgi:uncharacterized protein DUF1656
MLTEVSIGGVLVSPLIPCLFVTIPIFWLVDKLLRLFACYRFVWHADLVRIALFVIIFNLLLDLGI